MPFILPDSSYISECFILSDILLLWPGSGRIHGRYRSMKTIGLVGGMTWGATLEYYREINVGINEKLGGLSSASCLIYSENFSEIDRLLYSGCWDELALRMTENAQKLETSGADIILICCNAMHRVADQVQGGIDVPLLHIADAAADHILEKKLGKVALLGSSFVMEQEFYKRPLVEKGLEVIIPSREDRNFIQRVIAEELSYGKIMEDSVQRFKEIIATLAVEGAEGVILGCTELPLVVKDGDSDIPVFDTGKIHARRAVELALQ